MLSYDDNLDNMVEIDKLFVAVNNVCPLDVGSCMCHDMVDALKISFPKCSVVQGKV